MHFPSLFGYIPPYTLRRGGWKAAPTTCLIHNSWFWKKWKLEFGDVLAQEGVVDGRGVVSDRYGTKSEEDGTFKGYAVRKRHLGDSGKEWHKRQATATHDPLEPSEKARPEEVVYLTWASPFSARRRHYSFSWRGIVFCWKGTAQVQPPKNVFGIMLRFNHLKLVVSILGRKMSDTGLTTKDTQLCLARFTSVAALRKSGRLEIDEDMMDKFVTEHLDYMTENGEPQSPPSPPGNDIVHAGDWEAKCLEKEGNTSLGANTRARQRLRDLLVAMAMCMVIGEMEKRQVLMQVIAGLIGAGTS